MSMEELINISDCCELILIRYGKYISSCKAIYMQDDDVLHFTMEYTLPGYDTKKIFQYVIHNYDFLFTETEVQVNRSTINIISAEIEKRITQQVTK